MLGVKYQVSRGAGVKHFIIHARKAILGGLSPAQNRNIPPLKYDYVYRLVKEFPGVDFTLNGGINTYEEVRFCCFSDVLLLCVVANEQLVARPISLDV